MEDERFPKSKSNKQKVIRYTAVWCNSRNYKQYFPSGPVVKNPPANAEDTGLIPSAARSHM